MTQQKLCWLGNELYQGTDFVGRIMRTPKTGQGFAWEAWAIDLTVQKLGLFDTVDQAREAVENHLQKETA